MEVTIQIDGRQICTEQGTNVLEAALTNASIFPICAIIRIFRISVRAVCVLWRWRAETVSVHLVNWKLRTA